MFDPIETIKTALKKAQAIQPNAAISCLQATITDVKDPLNQGRCKVQLRNFAAANSSISYVSDWSNTDRKSTV